MQASRDASVTLSYWMY